MRVYCTSKNTGPSYNSDPVHMLYLGTSIKDAEKAVGDFVRYQRLEEEWPRNYPDIYSALPRDMEREMIQYYMADGWWYSIVMIDIQPTEYSDLEEHCVSSRSE